MPAEPAVAEPDLLDHLLAVFRERGYEGTSLRLLAERTGLQRSSLYHRFPGGKEQMALAVLDHVDRWFAERILGPLRAPGPPAERVRRMADALNEFYRGGARSCVLDTLSLGVPARVDGRVRASFAAWREALAALARETGAGAQEAARRADEAIVRIEGSLVVARATGDTRAFTRTLDALPSLLAG